MNDQSAVALLDVFHVAVVHLLFRFSCIFVFIFLAGSFREMGKRNLKEALMAHWCYNWLDKSSLEYGSVRSARYPRVNRCDQKNTSGEHRI